MPIDLMSETTLSLTDACRRLPAGRNGKRPTISCLIRWIVDGTPGPHGTRVRLEGLRVGGKWITSTEALQRYAETLTPRLDNEPCPAPRTPGQRDRANQRAGKRLAVEGM